MNDSVWSHTECLKAPSPMISIQLVPHSSLLADGDGMAYFLYVSYFIALYYFIKILNILRSLNVMVHSTVDRV